MPGTVLGTEVAIGNKKGKIPALMELMVQWGRQIGSQMWRETSGGDEQHGEK